MADRGSQGVALPLSDTRQATSGEPTTATPTSTRTARAGSVPAISARPRLDTEVKNKSSCQFSIRAIMTLEWVGQPML